MIEDNNIPMDALTVICRFEGKYDFLSNFHHQEVPIYFDGSKIPFYSVEAAFQCAKYAGPHMEDIRNIFANLTPDKAKHLGRALKLRPDWDEIKVDVMRDLLERKFSIDIYRDKLLATGDAQLIEGNTWHDTFWGMCGCDKHRCGQNQLGKLLVEIRKKLRNK